MCVRRGSVGVFVSSEKFIDAHSAQPGDLSIYGQEFNYTTRRLAGHARSVGSSAAASEALA